MQIGAVLVLCDACQLLGEGVEEGMLHQQHLLITQERKSVKYCSNSFRGSAAVKGMPHLCRLYILLELCFYDRGGRVEQTGGKLYQLLRLYLTMPVAGRLKVHDKEHISNAPLLSSLRVAGSPSQ